MITQIFRYRTLLSVLFFVFLFFTTFHLYRYNFDVDGIGAMMIAKRLGNHDWQRSINGVWSPLNSWLAALLNSFSWNIVITFKLINAICSLFIIILFHLISNQIIKANTHAQMLFLTAVSFVIPVMLLSYSHLQLSGDVLQLVFVLFYFYLIFRSDFHKKQVNSILIGIAIAAASYSKAFNLPFLSISHCVIVLFFIKNDPEAKRKSYVKSLALTYIILIALIIPWIYLIHLKYGVWSFSTVQKFNFNWLLNDQSYTTLNSPDLLMKPPYPDSPTAWEDPYLYYNYSNSGPLASTQNFFHFLKNILHNIKVLISSVNILSVLSIPILLYYLIQLFSGKKVNPKIIVLIFAILFSAFGYTLILVETRYIWLAGILLFLAGSKIVTDDLSMNLKPSLFHIVSFFFCISFLLNPVDILLDTRNKGKELYEVNIFFQKSNLKGNFTAINTNSSEGSWCDNIAFISDNRYFPITQPRYNESALINSSRQNNINFILLFFHSESEKEIFQKTETAKAAKEIIAIPGINAFALKF